MLKRVLFAACLAFAPTAVSAEWREAETQHFLIWSDSSEGELRKYAQRLEGVDQLMRKATAPRNSDAAHKVRVFLVADTGVVQRAYGGSTRDVAGFYTVNEAGPMAVSPRRAGASDAFFADEVLNHEYGHHFMLQYLPYTYPSWYVEGFAELFSTAAPMPGGKFAYGRPASIRAGSDARWLPVGKLMTAAYGDLSPDAYDFYGQSWLLTHFLTFDSKRSAQFKTYLRALGSGRGHEEAAAAFGDLAALNRDLRKYLAAGSFRYIPVPISPVDPATIKLRTLSAGEAALVPETIALRDWVAKDKAAAWLAAIRAKTGRFPKDPYALKLQSHAEFVAGEYLASSASADRALAIAPGDHKAMARKGMAMLRHADSLKGAERVAGIKAARGWFNKANRITPDEPLPLIGYYNAYAMLGADMPPAVIAGLERAHEVVPQDSGVRMMLVRHYEAEERYADAIRILGPLAFSPHASGEQKSALKLYEALKKKLAKPAAKSS